MSGLPLAQWEQIVRAGCPACGAGVLELRTFLDRTLTLMAADPTSEGKWAHDGEKFADATYRIACTACARVIYENDECPRCHAAGGLARALGEPSHLHVPKRCTKCNELELMAVAMLPASAKTGAGTPKPVALADFGEPGYHVVAYACDGCSHAVVADGCAVCGG